MAITRACEAVSAVMAEEGVPNAVTIYSDSQSVLQALNSRWITSKTVWECATALTDLGEFISVHLRWVKGLGFISPLFLVTALSSLFYLIANELPRPFFHDLIIGRPINFAVHRHIAFCNPFANPP